MVQRHIVLVEPDADRRRAILADLTRDPSVGWVDEFAYLDELLRVEDFRSDADVVVVNVDATGMSEMRDWALLRSKLGRDIRLVALTDGEDTRSLENLMGIGVPVMLLPDASVADLRRAVGKAARGEIEIDGTLLDRAEQLIGVPKGERVLRVGGILIDLTAQSVSRWGHPISLSDLEHGFLFLLATNLGKVITHGELWSRVWRIPAQQGSLDQIYGCAKRLRLKIEPNRKYPRYLKTVRGIGYVMQNPFASEG